MELSGCSIPEDRLYDLENDVWFYPEPGATTARVGILGTLASFAGKIQNVTFRPLEGYVAKGRSVGTLESIRFTGPVRLPVGATIVEQNLAVVKDPKLINDSPYDLGWMVRIQPAEESDRAALETAYAIAPRLDQRIKEMRIRCYPATPDAELYEIGLECSAVLVQLNDELARHDPGYVTLLVTDDPTSPIEMVRWSDQTGHSVLHHRVEGNLHHFLVRKESNPVPRTRGK